MATRMQQRRGTAAQWTGANPILAAGEIGFESDTNQFKIGDGVNHWDDLSYFKNLEDLGGSLDDYLLLTQKGSANGVATLDGNGQVPVSQLGNIIDGAPGVLDTLNELAAAIGDNADFASTVATHVSDTSAHGVTGDVVGTTDTQTLTNKTISGASNTLSNIAQSSVTNLTTDLSALDGRLDTAEGTLVTLGNTTTTLSEDLATANEDIANLETDKAPKASPTFTGTVDFTSATVLGIDALPSQTGNNGKYLTTDGTDPSWATLDLSTKQDVVSGVSSTEIGYLDGVTSAIQTQLDGKSATGHGHTLSDVTDVTASASEVNVLDGMTASTSELNILDGATLSTTELNYVDGVTSAIQTQLDAKAALAAPSFTGTVNAENVIISGDLTVSGTTTTVDTQDLVVTDPMIYMGDGNSGNLVDLGIVSAFNDGTYQHTGLVRDASASKWKLFKGVTDEPTTTVNFAQGSLDALAVGGLEVVGQQGSTTVDGNSVSTEQVNATTVVLNGTNLYDTLTNKLDSSTASSTYAPIASPTFTGTVTLPTGTVTSGMIADGTIVNGDISSSAAIALSKLATDPLARANHTGTQTASTISDFNEAAQDAIGNNVGTGLTYNDSTGAIAVDTSSIQQRVSGVSDTEIGYLDGVTSNIQTQLDAKAPVQSPTLNYLGSLLIGPMVANYGDVYKDTSVGAYKMWDGDSWNTVSTSFIQEAASPLLGGGTHKEVLFMSAGYEAYWSADGTAWHNTPGINGDTSTGNIAACNGTTMVISPMGGINTQNNNAIVTKYTDFHLVNGSSSTTALTGAQAYTLDPNYFATHTDVNISGIASNGTDTFVVSAIRTLKFIVSTDSGNSWTTVTVPEPTAGEGEGGGGEGAQLPYWNPPVYQHGYFYCSAFGSNGYIKSSDGVNWTLVDNVPINYSSLDYPLVSASGAILYGIDAAMGLVYKTPQMSEGTYYVSYDSPLQSASTKHIHAIGDVLYFHAWGAGYAKSFANFSQGSKIVFDYNDIGQGLDFSTATESRAFYGSYNFATGGAPMVQLSAAYGVQRKGNAFLHGQSSMDGRPKSLFIPIELYNKLMGEA